VVAPEREKRERELISVSGERGNDLQRGTLLTFLLALACGTLPPLRGKIDVGREPYVVLVGGSGLNADLYAARSEGGPVYPITFTPVAELAPALSPNGSDLAFLRGLSLRDSTPASVWVMNLLTGSERELALPKGADPPQRVGWSRDGQALIVGTAGNVYRFKAPPTRFKAEAVSPAERSAAESSLSVLLGDPVFARVVSCRKGTYLCVDTGKGAPGILAQSARDPARWGPDSVAFFVHNLLQIRPLKRGRPRILNWSDVPPRPRQMTFFEGSF
jgi:hypothetical protein